MPLPESITPGDGGHVSDHERVHGFVNGLEGLSEQGDDGDLLGVDGSGGIVRVDSDAYAPASVRVAAAADRIVAWDDFNRPDGLVETAPSGQPWQELRNSWRVRDGQARAVQVGLVNAVMVVECGTPDVRVDVDIILPDDVSNVAASGGIALRVIEGGPDDGQFVRLTWRTDNTIIELRVDSSVSPNADGTVVETVSDEYPNVAGSTCRVSAIARGPHIAAFVDGHRVLTHTLTGPQQDKYKDGTRHGIYARARVSGSNEDWAEFDNFVVRSL